MLIKNQKNVDVSGDEFDGVEASIKDENLAHIIDLITRQQYRDPIGSIVREVTSNCFDSHIEAGVDDPVVIRVNEDEEGVYISFIDVGVGLSPDRVKNVYLSYGSSTKRGSNKEIGGFGLGAKSPLAYQESFYVNTNHDGKHYEYIVHRGVKLPRMELLLTTDTQERNGTEVRIYLKQTHDYVDFAKAFKRQLAYFNNVYIEDLVFRSRIDNAYTIIEGEHFKYRKDSGYDGLHLCIGVVAYPIDQSQFPSINRSIWKIPVALKFNIGELVVTPERESVRYIEFVDDDGNEIKDEWGNVVSTKSVIHKKILQLVSELEDMYKAKTITSYDSLPFYVDHLGVVPYIKLDGTSINLEGIVEALPIRFTPLSEFRGTIPTSYKSIFSEYRIITEVSRNQDGSKSRELESILDSSLYQALVVRRKSRGKLNAMKNKYLLDEISPHYGVTRWFYIIEPKPIAVGRAVTTWLKLPIKEIARTNETTLLEQVKLYREVIEDEVIRHSIDYDNLEIPEDWIVKYKASRKKTTVKEEDEIIVIDIGSEQLTDKKAMKLSHIKYFTGILLYGFKEDHNTLVAWQKKFDNSKFAEQTVTEWSLRKKVKTRRSYRVGTAIHNSKKINIVEIAKKDEKYFKVKLNAVHIEDFMGDNRVFKRFATATLIKQESKAIRVKGVDLAYSTSGLDTATLFDFILPPVAETLREVNKHVQEYGNGSLAPKLDEAMIELAKDYNLIDEAMYEKHTKLERYFGNLQLLNYMQFTYDSLPFIAEYVKLKGKKVADIWVELLPEEKELLIESIDKANYQLGIHKETQAYILTCSNYELSVFVYKNFSASHKLSEFSIYSKIVEHLNVRCSFIQSQVKELKQISDYYGITK